MLKRFYRPWIMMRRILQKNLMKKQAVKNEYWKRNGNWSRRNMNSTEIYPYTNIKINPPTWWWKRMPAICLIMNNDPMLFGSMEIRPMKIYIRSTQLYSDKWSVWKYKLGRFTILIKSQENTSDGVVLKFWKINEIDLGYRLLKKNWGKGVCYWIVHCHAWLDFLP